MKIALAFAIGVLLAFGCGSRALAIAEFCPGEIQLPLHPLESKTAPSTLFSYTLRAEGQRSVAGSVIFDTSMGWFVVNFPATPITERAYHMHSNAVTFTRKTFESDPLYVRFPQPLTITGAYVSTATATGDNLFDWDAKGTVQCAPRAGFGTPQENAMPPDISLKTLDPRPDLDAMPSADAKIAVAAITSAPGATDCAVPFAEATVVSPAAPDYPTLLRDRGLPGEVWVEVAVNGDGTLADAWIYAPSGSRDFDAAALRAARLTRYQGGRVFCQPAGGDYIFAVQFNP